MQMLLTNLKEVQEIHDANFAHDESANRLFNVLAEKFAPYAIIPLNDDDFGNYTDRIAEL